MSKFRWLVVASALVVGCDEDPVREPGLLAEAVVFGIVRDEASVLHPQFSVTFEGTSTPDCHGPPFWSNTRQFGGSGAYRMVVSTRFVTACNRIIVTVPDNNVIPDTTFNVDLDFSSPPATDSLRHDVLLRRRDAWLVRVRAMLGTGSPGSIQIAAPDTVTRNQPFTVTSSHHGSSSCTTLDTVEVSYNGQTAILSPYVFERVVGGCTADLHHFTHTAQVTLTQTGPATIRVIGRDTTVTRTTFVR